MKTREPNGGYTQVRASEALVIEPAKSWQRLQRAKEFFFADLDELSKEHHRRFLDLLMLEERQQFCKRIRISGMKAEWIRPTVFTDAASARVWGCWSCR